ncbi:hypothetical protein [Neotabrizicola shimadae]|uniref:hypothetical protein n=1 Tax=Neotabrizicola shimadae TaxID=2807096 RepID=UPI001C7D58B3|nr:hypothetical protein [Neotabrizicola shimadae]
MRHFEAQRAEGRQQAALDFVWLLFHPPVPRIALENPVSIIGSAIRKPDQIIQPWQFGHREMTATCLWLKGLPPLVPTDIVGPPPVGRIESRSWEVVHRMPPGPDRWKARSRTCLGTAAAMAAQWSLT